jgi:hypothetical protein
MIYDIMVILGVQIPDRSGLSCTRRGGLTPGLSVLLVLYVDHRIVGEPSIGYYDGLFTSN